MKCSTERLMKLKRAREQARKHGFRDFNMPRAVSKIKDPELKAKWVAALRSGEYKQGNGRLKRYYFRTEEPAFCCLGVLCDVVKPEGWDGEVHNFSGKSTQQEYPNLNSMKELGIYPSAVKALAKMNDEDKLPFNKIADYIEKNL
jgi:hypothetical protein